MFGLSFMTNAGTLSGTIHLFPRIVFLVVKVCCWVWFVKLGLQKTHWLCWPEEPRCHMLHELPATDALLHKQTETGEMQVFFFFIYFI